MWIDRSYLNMFNDMIFFYKGGIKLNANQQSRFHDETILFNDLQMVHLREELSS